MKFLRYMCFLSLGIVFTFSRATTANAFYTRANTDDVDFTHLQQQPLPDPHARSRYFSTDEHILELKPIIIPHEYRPLRHRKRSMHHESDDHDHTPEMDAFACHSQDSFLYGNSEGTYPSSHLP